MQAEDLDMPNVDNDLPAMPIVTTSLRGFALPAERREKHADATSAAFAATVAKSITIREANAIPTAQAALDKEWKKLWEMKCWEVESVYEYDAARSKATKNNETVHFGRVFPIVVERGSELPPEQRKYK